jgi:hypothetical protein
MVLPNGGSIADARHRVKGGEDRDREKSNADARGSSRRRKARGNFRSNNCRILLYSNGGIRPDAHLRIPLRLLRKGFRGHGAYRRETRAQRLPGLWSAAREAALFAVRLFLGLDAARIDGGRWVRRVPPLSGAVRDVRRALM